MDAAGQCPVERANRVFNQCIHLPHLVGKYYHNTWGICHYIFIDLHKLQCNLHEATLEKYPKASAVTKCSHIGNFDHPKNSVCNTAWTALGDQFTSGSDSRWCLWSIKHYKAQCQVTYGTIFTCFIYSSLLPFQRFDVEI